MIGSSVMHVKNGAMKNVQIWEGKKDPIYVIYVAIIKVDLNIHYLKFVNYSKVFILRNFKFSKMLCSIRFAPEIGANRIFLCFQFFVTRYENLCAM